MADAPRVLLTTLNWGLGHATRCIPIVRELERQGAKVFLGSDGQSLELLQEEFPRLRSFELPAYAPRYGSKRSFELEMALQIPKFFSAIRQEEKLCAELCRKHRIDRIISDNRWGCAPKGTPSVFMTHQLFVKLNGVMKLAESSLLSLQNRLLHKFEAVWVPDWKGRNSLSGELSQGTKTKREKFPLPIEFIAPLSRLDDPTATDKKFDLLFLLSGPEPQRSHFEEILLKQCLEVSDSDLRILFIRGSNDESSAPSIKTQKKLSKKQSKSKNNFKITVKNRLNSAEVSDAIQASKTIVARSGYSSIMDFCKIQAKCILIPTPGQTEQEYLADRLSQKKFCLSARQDSFKLNEAFQSMEKLKGFPVLKDNSFLEKAVSRFLKATT